MAILRLDNGRDGCCGHGSDLVAALKKIIGWAVFLACLYFGIVIAAEMNSPGAGRSIFTTTTDWAGRVGSAATSLGSDAVNTAPDVFVAEQREIPRYVRRLAQ